MKPCWLRATFLAVSFLLVGAARTQAQWTWLYPTPHGNNLYDVTFVDDVTAIAVGDVGTVMVSHDAGTTWTTTIRTNGVASKLNRIDRIDNLTAVAVGNNGAILKTIDGGNTWITESGAGVSDLTDVSFSGMTGIAIGYGPYPTPNRMYRSTNGGDSWAPVAGAPLPAYGIEMATPLVGYCLAGYTIFKSVDGGLTWNYLPNAPGVPSYSHTPISFADAMNGVISGVSSQIYVTHDGGNSWTGHQVGGQFTEGGSFASDLEFRSPSTLAASVISTICDLSGGPCSSWGDLFRSSSDGASWQHDGGQRSLYGVALDSFGIVIAVGESGIIHQFIPPGTWQQRAGTTAFDELPDAAHIAFRTPATGVVLGSSTYGPYTGPVSANEIFSTLNGGNSWGVAYWGYPYSNLNDIAFAAGTPDLYAAATVSDGITKSSALLKSTDMGASWVTAWSSAQDLKFVSLEFSSATHGVAVGSGGSAIVIDGATVTPISIASGVQGVTFADGSTAIAVGGGTTRIIRSADGGSTWTPITSPVAKTLYDVAFANPSVGAIVGPNNVVLRTVDGGLSWTPISTPLPATEFLDAVSFFGNYGVAVGGYNGSIVQTEDAGLTWTILPPPATGLLSDVVVFGAHHALVAGPEMTVLEYRENTVPTLFSSFHAVARELAAELRWSVQDEADLQAFRLVRDGAALATLSRDARTYRDESVRPGASYDYTLVAVDATGNETQSAPIRVTIPKVPLQLLPNQPNPFNPETMIRFIVPEKTRVTLTVHDVSGRVVATLIDDVREPGMQTMAWNAQGLASGVYFAKLRAGKTEVSRKMVLLK